MELVVLSRDTRAILIPDGEAIGLPEGTHVRITQTLGDTFTVMTDYGQMLRIDAEDADALGKEKPEPGVAEDPEASLEDRVWAALKKCYDPEIPVNIVDLGLVYSCEVRAPEDDGRHKVDVKMTLTAPGCGMGPVLADDVKRGVEKIPQVSEGVIELVFDPPWNPEMMSEAARLELGMF